MLSGPVTLHNGMWLYLLESVVFPMEVAHHDRVKLLPMHRVATVQPFTRFLADVGVSIERSFQQAGLPYCALESVDNYVPSQHFWSFLVNMAYSQGIEDLGFRVGQRFGASSPDPHMASLLRSSPTMYRGLLKASAMVNKTVTNCRFGIHQPTDCNYSLFYHQPSCSADNPAVEQIGWYGLMALLDMVRVFTGPQWKPTEIGIMTDRSPGHNIREQFPQTRIRQLQPYSYVMIENPLLSLPPLADKDPAPDSSSIHYKPLPGDLVEALEQLMLSYGQEFDLSVEFVASLCNTSKRTLQRQLKEKGTHYSELLVLARYRAACHMLQAPGLKVTDIAHRLGYSDLASFSRAFRSIAGVTPRAYRQQYIH